MPILLHEQYQLFSTRFVFFFFPQRRTECFVLRKPRLCDIRSELYASSCGNCCGIRLEHLLSSDATTSVSTEGRPAKEKEKCRYSWTCFGFSPQGVLIEKFGAGRKRVYLTLGEVWYGERGREGGGGYAATP